MYSPVFILEQILLLLQERDLVITRAFLDSLFIEKVIVAHLESHKHSVDEHDDYIVFNAAAMLDRHTHILSLTRSSSTSWRTRARSEPNHHAHSVISTQCTFCSDFLSRGNVDDVGDSGLGSATRSVEHNEWRPGNAFDHAHHRAQWHQL